MTETTIRPNEIEMCKEWIGNFCKPRKTPCRFGSYGLKHIVERYYRSYVSNESFIAAAGAMGYAPQWQSNGVNANFCFWVSVDGFRGSEDLIKFRRPTKGYL